MIPKIEEFMIFEDEDGQNGVIIKSNSFSKPWWKCFKGTGGQIFDEKDDDSNYKKIKKLYKCKLGHTNCDKYYALKYMINGDLSEFNCIYDKSEDEPKIINCNINISIPNNMNINDILDLINKELKKVKFS